MSSKLNFSSSMLYIMLFYNQFTNSMSPQKQYVMRFSISMTLYVVVLIASLYVIEDMDRSLLRAVIALLPIIPVTYSGYAFVSLLGKLDEMQRKIHFEAFGISIAATGILTFSLAFLEKAGYPTVDLFWVLPCLIGFWGIGVAITQRRYS